MAMSPSTQPLSPQVARLLRERGLRWTRQREQVLEAVRELGHATPEQVHRAVTGIDLATVYRTLDVLEEIGLIKHMHLGHGAPAYRPAEDEHIHVVCHQCGSVVDVPHSLVDDLQRRLRAERGFELDRAHLTVFGRCADCAAAGPPVASVLDTPEPHVHAAEHSRSHRRWK